MSTTVEISTLFRRSTVEIFLRFPRFFNFDVDSTLNQRRNCPLGIDFLMRSFAQIYNKGTIIKPKHNVNNQYWKHICVLVYDLCFVFPRHDSASNSTFVFARHNSYLSFYVNFIGLNWRAIISRVHSSNTLRFRLPCLSSMRGWLN